MSPPGGPRAASGLATRRLRRILRDEQERQLAARAVAEGLLDDAAVAAAAARGEASGRGLLDELVVEGKLARGDVERLERGAAREDLGRVLPPVPPPPEAAEAAQDPRKRLADFVLMERLGRGGAGEVFKAWDLRLGRWVAVKLPVVLSSAEAEERFQREALAVARLSHPNIVSVHQVGSDGGRPFLVMPFIEGETLAERRVPIRQAVEIVRAAALAVEYAHQQGVVHRDLKPGNIMIGRDGRVSILDFGLVHLASADPASATRPGSVMGTAPYMSPEQARGDTRSHAPTTDVYGLGATLFHLLAGRAPFQGDGFAAIVAQVLSDDPPPLRRLAPEVPRDLEAVVNKAMDKEPGRRYQRAADLAEDLRRVLDVEPVSARTAGPLDTMVRRVRRRRHVLGVGVAVAGAAILVGVTRRHARRERDDAIGAIRTLGGTLLDTVLRLRRAGDFKGMLAAAADFAPAYERARKLAPDAAEVEYVMGRIERALLRNGPALEHQNRAVALEPRFAPARYERAILQSILLGNRLVVERQRTILRGDAGAAATDESSAAALQAEIVRDLQELDQGGVTPARAAAARGVLAHHRGDRAAARAALQQAVQLDPSLEEAWEHLAMAAQAQRDLDAADAAYTEGLRHDAGYSPHLVGRCRVRVTSGDYDGAVADADRAIAIGGDDLDARRCRAIAHMLRGATALQRNLDPTVDLDAAHADAAEVMRRQPAHWEAWHVAQLIQHDRAVLAILRGRDPEPLLAEARTLFAGGEKAAGAYSLAPLRGRGLVHLVHAYRQVLVGVDPAATLDAAEVDLERAGAMQSPRDANNLAASASVHALRALHAAREGRDVSSSLAQALDGMARAVAAGGAPWMRVQRAGVLGLAARFAVRDGVDPLPHWNAAETDLREALSDAKYAARPAPWLRLARVLIDRARYRAAGHVTSRRDDVAEAARALARVAATDPQLGMLWLLHGDLALDAGDVRGAQAAYERALREQPGLAPFLVTRRAALRARKPRPLDPELDLELLSLR